MSSSMSAKRELSNSFIYEVIDGLVLVDIDSFRDDSVCHESVMDGSSGVNKLLELSVGRESEGGGSLEGLHCHCGRD